MPRSEARSASEQPAEEWPGAPSLALLQERSGGTGGWWFRHPAPLLQPRVFTPTCIQSRRFLCPGLIGSARVPHVAPPVTEPPSTGVLLEASAVAPSAAQSSAWRVLLGVAGTGKPRPLFPDLSPILGAG